MRLYWNVKENKIFLYICMWISKFLGQGWEHEFISFFQLGNFLRVDVCEPLMLRFCVNSQSLCEFICASVQFCLEDTLFLQSASTSGSYNILNLKTFLANFISILLYHVCKFLILYCSNSSLSTSTVPYTKQNVQILEHIWEKTWSICFMDMVNLFSIFSSSMETLMY